MRSLVTGGAGFIGSHLVDALLHRGHEVVVVDNLATGRRSNLGEAASAPTGRLRVVDLDIRSDSLASLFAEESPEVVYHLAAQMDVRASVRAPLYDADVNVLGTVNVLESSVRAGARKVVFTSSGGCIYGPPDERPVDEDFPTRPHSPYGAAKLSAETYLSVFHRLHGMDFTTLALGNVFGPRQDPNGEAGVVAIFGAALLGGRPTTIFGDGTSSRDYVYVADVVAALLTAAVSGGPRRYNIGTGAATTVRRLHSALARCVGAPDAPVFAPPRPAELDAIALDCRRAQQDLGWTARTTLHAGLTQTVEWIAGDLQGATA